jgi:hypothetical protein
MARRSATHTLTARIIKTRAVQRASEPAPQSQDGMLRHRAVLDNALSTASLPEWPSRTAEKCGAGILQLHS